MNELNEQADVRLARIGQSGMVVSIIDNVLLNPDRFAALGLSQSFAHDRSNLYPGVRARVPESFSAPFRSWLTAVLRRNGVLESQQSIYRDDSFFSAVTTAPTDLLPIQRIPHYDSTDPNLFAVVIYLCDPKFSGTSFYKHRKTGYEAITEKNEANYKLALDNDMRLHGAPKKQYVNGTGPLFEVIFSSELKFNRAIIYPGRALHAANIESSFSPPKHQSEWRLTLTALIQAA